MDGRWTVWALSPYNQQLLGRREDPIGGYRWTGYGTPGVTKCGTTGVAAADWVQGGTVNERVYCVGENNHLYEYALANRVPIGTGWRDLGAPPNGHWLTGQLQATAAQIIGGSWTVYVFLTTSHNRLTYWYEPVTGGANWGELDGGAETFSGTAQLAVSRAPGSSPSYLHVFAARTDGNVRVLRRSSSQGWRAWTIAKPLGVDMFARAAAAEEQIDGSNYRVYLFCTASTQSNLLWAASAVSSDNDAQFTWSSRALGAGKGQINNSTYSVAATARRNGTTRAIEAYALATVDYNAPSPERIYSTRFATGQGGLTTLADIGLDGETWVRWGGLAAYPALNRSHVAFLGRSSLQSPGAVRLYVKDGAGLAPGDPWNWRNHGNGAPWNELPPAKIGETSASFQEGRAIVVGIDHPGTGGTGDYPRVRSLFSQYDGDSWDPAGWREVPTNGFEATSDPTADISSDGKAFITVAAASFPGGLCFDASGFTSMSVFYVWTDDRGQTFHGPYTLSVPGNRIDHPWMEIERDSQVGDRIHWIWSDTTADNVVYASAEVDPVCNPCALEGPYVLTSGSPPPVLTVGAQGAVYAQFGQDICRINDDHTGCEHDPQPFLYTHEPATFGVPLNDGSGLSFKPGPISLVASPSDPDVVYYAYTYRENGAGNAGPFDVFLSVGTYTDTDGHFDWTTPAPLGEYTNDGADQFAPTIAVSRDRTAGGNVFVSWHERHWGDCDGSANRCYRARRSVSFNGGVSFLYPQTIPVDAPNSLSDPSELPVSCISGEPFLGHYRTIRGDLLHSRFVVTGSPNDGVYFSSTQATGWVSGGYYYW